MADLPRPYSLQQFAPVFDEPSGGKGLIPIVDSTGRTLVVVQTALPAGSATLGKVIPTDGTDDLAFNPEGSLAAVMASLTGKLYEGTPGSHTALPVKYAAVAASSSGDNTLVTGVSSKKIRVISYVLSASAQVNAKFQSATAGDKTGLIYMAQYGGAVANENKSGWFETAAGEDLQLNLSGNVAVGGHLSYVEAS